MRILSCLLILCIFLNTSCSNAHRESFQYFNNAEKAYLKGDYKEAIKWYEKAADLGNSAAMIALGIIYSTPTNDDSSLPLSDLAKKYDQEIIYSTPTFENIAAQNYILAKSINPIIAKIEANPDYLLTEEETAQVREFKRQTLREKILANPDYELTPKEEEFVKEYQEFKKGSKQADNAPLLMARQTSKWLELGYFIGKSDRVYCFKIAYIAAHDNVPEDPREAIKWYKKAADLGNSAAIYILGYSYANGDGVLKDPREAIKWYKKAAGWGDTKAMLALGNIYADGEIVPRDYKQAKYWIKKSYEAGNLLAREYWKKLELWKYNYTLIDYLDNLMREYWTGQNHSN
jgi:TPR repeat protein